MKENLEKKTENQAEENLEKKSENHVEENFVDKIINFVKEIERLLEELEKPLFKIIITLLSLIGLFAIFMGKLSR